MPDQMNQMMVDLETLGTSGQAAMIQLGWAVFDLEGDQVIASEQVNVSLDDSIRLGGVVEEASFKWWLDQSLEARASMIGASVTVLSALNMLSASWNLWRCKRVWSHGASFDIPILDFHFRAVGHIQPPWRYSAVHDTRTLYDMAARLGWEREKWDPSVIAHTAGADARAQVGEVQSAWRHIVLKTQNHTGT